MIHVMFLLHNISYVGRKAVFISSMTAKIRTNKLLLHNPVCKTLSSKILSL